ncbi:MAG: phage terminase large subunit family protein [Methylococcaceae bacterium]|nr:MAG: phage terminase large subunit family protein [Methylococcaceae bacterium]
MNTTARPARKPKDKRVYRLLKVGKSYCYQRLARHIARREKLTVSTWADRYRWLSGKGSAEKGLWRTSRTPYLKEIMDVLSPHSPVQEIVIMKSSQVGVTECTINWIGCIMHHAPAPTMVLLPTEESRDAWVQQKLNPMITESDAVNRVMQGAKSRDAGNRKDLKEFPGGMLFLAGGNSPNSYAQRTARYVMLDDADRFPAEVGKEGDPVSLARGRCKAFPNSKLVIISTPTIDGASVVAGEFEDTDQRHYHVPCPHCGEYQPLHWKNLQWDLDTDRAWYVCEIHGCLIEEHEKPRMLAQGRWEAKNPKHRRRGYHLSALYAAIGLGPSWVELAREWKAAQGDQRKLRTFINTHLGETWKDKTRDIRPETLQERAEDYRLRTVPPGFLLLTAGVDTQDDRLSAQILGWGEGEVCAVIDWVELFGDPEDEALWDRLTTHLNTPLENAYGQVLYVEAAAIDAMGHHTHAVYHFVRQKKIRRPMAIQGSKRLAGPILSARPTYQDVRWGEKVDKKGCALWQVGVNTVKSTLYNRLAGDAEREACARKVRFSSDLPLDYYKQLLSEVYDPLQNRYVKLRGRHNEGLDTWGYACAASHNPDPALRVHRKTAREWARLRAMLEPADVEPTPAPTPSTNALFALKAAASSRNDSGFLKAAMEKAMTADIPQIPTAPPAVTPTAAQSPIAYSTTQDKPWGHPINEQTAGAALW